MLRRRRWLSALLPALAVLGCAQTTPVDSASEERAITAVREREIRAFNAGAVDSVLAVLTTDAVMMPPNQPMLTGTEAIRTWLQNIASQFSVEGRYTDSEIQVVGDWGIERFDGAWRLTPKAGGPPVEEQLKGIHVYRRQADGSWRIAQDIWNANAAPPPIPASR